MSEYELNTPSPTVEEVEIGAEKKTGKKSWKKGLLIGGIVLAVVAVIAVIVLTVLANTPAGLLATGFRNSKDALESNSFSEKMNQVSNGGSMEITLDLANLMAESGLPMGGTGSLKFYMDSEKGKSVMTLGVLLANIRNMDMSLFFNEDSLVLASDWLLGDKAYGVGYNDLEENFNNSVFGPDGAYSLGIEVPEDLQEQLDKYQKYTEDTEKIAAQLGNHLLESAGKNASLEKANATLSLGGKEVKTTAVSIKMDHDQLAAVMEDTLEYMRTDEDFKAYMKEYADILFSDSWADPDTLVEEFYQELDDAKDEMDELKKELEEEEAGVEVVFHITKSGKQMVGIELTFESNISPVQLSFYAGPDLESANEISFRVDADGSIVRGSYVVTTNDKKAYAAELMLREDGETVLSGQVNWDKTSGDLVITMTDEWEDSVVIRGTLVETKMVTDLTLDSIEMEGEQVELGLGVVLKTSDKMPDSPAYKDILKMTEAEVTSLITDLSMVFLQMAYSMA